MADLIPHPVNPAWRYDPADESGIVTDASGRQVGVDFDGRVHNEFGMEIDTDEQPVAMPDGTPLPPEPNGYRPDGTPKPPHSGRPHGRPPGSSRTPSVKTLRKKFPALKQIGR